MKHQIMTFEEYAKSRHEAPYVFEIENGNKKITYFGARHSQNPADPMFARIEQKFSSSNPEIVFVEGVDQLKTQKPHIIKMLVGWSRETSIKEMGESGFVLKLAIESGVEIESPEPEFKDELAHLLRQGFSREDIFAYYLYRQIEQYHRMVEKPALDAYLDPHLRGFRLTADWEDFECSLNNLEAIGKKIWGERGGFETNNVSRTDPTPWNEKKDTWTAVNQIAQQSSYFRDEYIVQRIADVMKQKNRLFVVFGASHAYMQESALRKLFENL